MVENGSTRIDEGMFATSGTTSFERSERPRLQGRGDDGREEDAGDAADDVDGEHRPNVLHHRPRTSRRQRRSASRSGRPPGSRPVRRTGTRSASRRHGRTSAIRPRQVKMADRMTVPTRMLVRAAPRAASRACWAHGRRSGRRPRMPRTPVQIGITSRSWRRGRCRVIRSCAEPGSGRGAREQGHGDADRDHGERDERDVQPEVER